MNRRGFQNHRLLLDTFGEYLTMQAREPADSQTRSDPE